MLVGELTGLMILPNVGEAMSASGLVEVWVVQDDQITRDAIVTEATRAGTSTLKEIDFGHQKEALVVDQNPGGM